ncbi:uncharacterized protein LOC121398191 [Xenopus laevis]|uniref:Superoxide dismutase copper/zinc binding domain-containing protein n=2 Tax=Xenopus laevis TaxID=8355 RepID=A0A974H4W6_XENLA|nr:uncharacterized protein LOC121398191 [Xenopus laevis]OCT64595.1 hypothetical protein XELAEV_18045694mg [Xenopus laevis]
MLLLAEMMLLLLGSFCRGEFSAQIDMEGVRGYISMNISSQTITANLSGACTHVKISIHEFPVFYGASQDPCHTRTIGPSQYQLSLNASSQGSFKIKQWPLGQSVVVEACGHLSCTNLHDTSGPLQIWHATFHSFVVGHLYFLKVMEQDPIIVLTDLAQLQETPESHASLFFANSCDTRVNQSLGNFTVGNRTWSLRSRKELMPTTVMPFVLLEFQSKIICVKLKPLRSKKALAHFSMHGVSGHLLFMQNSPFHPTELELKLGNLKSLFGHYSIHSLPVLAHRGPGQNLCNQNGTGDIWNPLGVNRNTSSYPKQSGSGHNLWQMGDLSGRHGSFQGYEEISTNLIDWNLPLYGNNSIVGRSVVLSKTDGIEWVCSTIRQEGDIVVATASFRKGAVGRVVFRQPLEDSDHDLSILVELSSVSGQMSNGHNWHVHEFPLQLESDSCASVGAHFNPHNVSTGGNYKYECKYMNPLLCELGDYAGRHTPITLACPYPTRYLFTDSYSSITGPTSILGKALVIHGPDGAAYRLACANIIPQHPIEGKTGPWFGSGDAQGMLTASQISDLDPTTVNITFHELKNRSGGYHIHQLPVISGSMDPCSNSLIKGHFNPFGVNVSTSPPAGNGTDDEYEMGDISGRRGLLMGKDHLVTQFTDTNFPLSGTHSILGRSLVIHYTNGSRMQCANFLPDLKSGGDYVRAQANFNGTISGSISLSQVIYPDGGSSDTIILVDLLSTPGNANKSTNLQWYLPSEATGMEFYNPYEIPVQMNHTQGEKMCGSLNPLHCKVGDLTSKHGTISAGNRNLLTDINLPLTGDFTVIGKSLVLKPDTLEPVSAKILPDVPLFTLYSPTVTPFNRTAFCKTVSTALKVPTWKIILISKSQGRNETCYQVTFFIIGFNDKIAVASLVSPGSLGFFPNSSSCQPVSQLSGAYRTSAFSGIGYFIVVLFLLRILHF